MPTYYKFISDADAAQFLFQGAIKFTPVAELNDPSELMPNVLLEEVKSSLARLRKQGYNDDDLHYLRAQGHLLKQLAPRFQAVSIPGTKEQATALIRSPFYDSISLLERLLDDTAREISSKVGVFCLSRRYDSLPMWAHYAGNAAGLVVEFADLEGVFPGDVTGVLRRPVAVRYDRHVWGVTFDPQSHESLFFAKFPDWRYEEEVRVVLPLTDCRRKAFGEKVLYAYDIPRSCVKRAILGWRMPPEKRDLVHGHARTHNPEVEIVQARFVRGRIELQRTIPAIAR